MIFLLSLFSVPTGAVDGITFYIGDLLESVGPFIWLIIGIPLGFYVIWKVQKMFTKK